MFIICLYSNILSDSKTCLVFNPEKLRDDIKLSYLTIRHHVFCLWFHALNLLYVTSLQKQVTDVSLVLKDSDTESENLSSLIRLSVSDGQKTEFKRCIIYRYIIKLLTRYHSFGKRGSVGSLD